MKKVVLILITIYPLFYMVIFVAYFFSVFTNPSYFNESIFFTIIPFHLLAMAAILFNLVYYLIHALNNKKLKKEERNVWFVLIFILAPFTAPIYLYKYIVKTSK